MIEQLLTVWGCRAGSEIWHLSNAKNKWRNWESWEREAMSCPTLKINEEIRKVESGRRCLAKCHFYDTVNAKDCVSPDPPTMFSSFLPSFSSCIVEQYSIVKKSMPEVIHRQSHAPVSYLWSWELSHLSRIWLSGYSSVGEVASCSCVVTHTGGPGFESRSRQALLRLPFLTGLYKEQYSLLGGCWPLTAVEDCE